MPKRNKEYTNMFSCILPFISFLLSHFIRNFNILQFLCFPIPICFSTFCSLSLPIQLASLFFWSFFHLHCFPLLCVYIVFPFTRFPFSFLYLPHFLSSHPLPSTHIFLPHSFKFLPI